MAKAWPIEGLSPEAPVVDCARRIVETRFREVFHYREGTVAGEDITQLHAMRVSTRRLRAALRNFRACFPRDELKYHSRRIRDLARALGAVRDLDVRLRWLNEIRETASEPELPGIDLLIDRAASAREEARKPMVKMLDKLQREHYEDDFFAFVHGGGR